MNLCPPAHTVKTTAKQGFSLVEMTIVIGIIGILAGGIIAGQHLLRSAELNAAVKEHEYLAAATRNFIDKYGAYPGDMNNATRFFGRLIEANANADTLAWCLSDYPDDNVVASGGTCNGGGDKRIGRSTWPTGGSPDLNTIQRIIEYANWAQHLSAGGMIEGDYGGILAWIQAGGVLIGGETQPPSKIASGMWLCAYTDVEGIMFLSDKEQHYIHLIGDRADLTVGVVGIPPALKPQEAYALDSKIDDGKPALGKVITFTGYSSYTDPSTGAVVGDLFSNCTVKADGTSPTEVGDTDAKYNLSYNGIACPLSFVVGF